MNKKILFKIINVSLSTILISFTIVILIFAFGAFRSRQVPVIFDHSLYIVRSNSMQPSFSAGSLLFVKNMPAQDISEGDVITFKRSNDSIPVTHRVIQRTGSDNELSFITKGDANNTQDPLPVPENIIIGKVVFVIPYLGYILGFTTTRLGFMLILIVPGLILLLSQIHQLLPKKSGQAGNGSESETIL